MPDLHYSELATIHLPSWPSLVKFNSDGRYLYAVDGVARYAWTVPDLDEVLETKINPAETSREKICHLFNDREKVLLLASDDDSEEGIHHIAIRDFQSNKLLSEADIHLEEYGVLRLLFNRTEDRVMLGDAGSNGHFLRLPSFERIQTISFYGASSHIFSPDESQIWAHRSGGSPEDCNDYLIAFDILSGEVARQKRVSEYQQLDRLVLINDRQTLLVVDERSLSFLDPDSWEIKKNVPVSTYWGHSGPATAITRDGSLLALSCDYNRQICFVDCEEWDVIGLCEVGDDFCVSRLDFSPDGKYLVIASWGGEILKFWEIFL